MNQAQQLNPLRLAHDIGANIIKAQPTEAERLRFEAWMNGHCWKVCGQWDGATYSGSNESPDYFDPQVMHTRQLFAAWRDCAALRDQIAAPSAQAVEPAAVVVPNEDLQDLVSKALRRAWQLGQTYWQQADSEYTSHHKKADETQAKFSALIEETRDALAATPPAPAATAIPAIAPDLLPPMGIRNDRDMLNYLMDAFNSEVSYCERCGHGEDTKDMDSANFLREYLSAAPQAQDVQRDAARVSLPIHWMKELVALCGPEDHELRDRVLKSLERLPLAHAGQLDELNKGEVLVVVTGYTGTGKSAVAGEIEIMCRALGLEVEWPGGDSEKNMTHADWTAALEQYRPSVRIVERNVPGPIAASAAKGGA